MRPPADIRPILDDCRATLRAVDDGLRWAYSAGYYPSHRWVGEPPGREMYLADAEQDRKDQIPGYPDDISQGDYKARLVVRRAGPSLTKASEHLEDACVIIAAAAHMQAVPKSPVLPAVVHMESLLRAIRTIDSQLALIESVDPQILNDQAHKHVAGRLVQARARLSTLRAALDRWSSNVPESRKLPVTLCKTCSIRPCPIRKGRIANRECDTCATWRHRHRGQTRPPSLDDSAREAPLEAQARRVAAGEGWGWS